jgi:hypothetical protein
MMRVFDENLLHEIHPEEDLLFDPLFVSSLSLFDQGLKMTFLFPQCS